MTPTPATKIFTVDRIADLLPDDVIVDTVRGNDGDFARVRRALPVPPTYEPGTFGTAFVHGSRIQGVIDEDGEFNFLVYSKADGVLLDYTGDFHGFVPENQ